MYSIYHHWQRPSFTQARCSRELGTLTEWKRQQWQRFQTYTKALVKTQEIRGKAIDSPSGEILLIKRGEHSPRNDYLSSSTEAEMNLTWGPRVCLVPAWLFGILTTRELFQAREEIKVISKKKHKWATLPEMVSRYLVNQQRQYLEQTHNRQIAHSDSHTRPVGFMRKN